MKATVTKLHQNQKSVKSDTQSVSKPRRKAATPKSVTHQQRAGQVTLVIAGILTLLSLSHLAHGVQVVTHAPMWEAWAMAIGIDLGFLACEAACVLAATDAAKSIVNRFAKPTVIATMVASAIMNSFAFSSAIQGIAVIPAIALGAAIPALIYSLTRIGIALTK